MLFLIGPVLVLGTLLFGILLAAVMTSRSTAGWSRPAAVLLSLGFLVATVLIAQALAQGSGIGLAIGEASVVLVGMLCLLLVVVMTMKSDSSLVRGLARWSPVIIAGSLLLGVVGLIAFSALNVPVQQMAVVEGIGPANQDTFTVLLTLRNLAPIVISVLAAVLGAAAWRATGRLLGAAATLLGCVGIALQMVLLFLQSGD